MCTKSKSPFLICFLATLQRFIFLLIPLVENVLQEDDRQPSGGFAARMWMTDDIPPGAIVGPTCTTLRMWDASRYTAIALVQA